MAGPRTRTLRALRAACAVAAVAASGAASAGITLYEHDDFQGRTVSAQSRVDDLSRSGFNDMASSAVVTGGRWEVCVDAGFQGECRVLRPGEYRSLSAMGLNDRISSMRALGRNVGVADDRYAPAPAGEGRYYDVPVRSVRAVVGQNDQRCWVEKERVQKRNVPGAIAGAVIGGVLGHQIGGGTGRDLTTIGGAVAGGAIGANVNRSETRDVQHCAQVPADARATYWDVTYDFQGQEHHAQLANPPGATIRVSENGEPRL